MKRCLALLLLLGACGPAKQPTAATAGSGQTNTTPDSASGGAASGGSGGSEAAAGGGGTSSAGAKPGGSAAGATGLVLLSTSDPDCALDAEGRPWRWPAGRLERAPVQITGAKAITCSSTHTCVVAEDASAMCWGDNMYGALGDGTQKSSPEAAVKVAGLTDVAEIVADVSRTCARTKGGAVHCWGDREFAKAGDGTLIDGHKGREKPLAGKPVLGVSGATSLGISLIHACATTGDGNVMCWGQCRSGACGQPPRPPWLARAVKAPKVKDVGMLSAGEDVTCGIDKTGGVLCWGSSQYGVLGESVTDNKPRDSGVKIGLPAPAAEVAVGVGGHACARLTTGAVHCWGHNDQGQLGDGTTVDRKSPAPVKGIAKATRIAAGLGSACAIVEGGRLYCWGDKRGNVPVEIPMAK